MAADRGLATLALTDHDTVAGVDEARAAGAAVGVRVVAGVELSVRVSQGSLHLLGYFAEEPPSGFTRLLAGLEARRVDRAREMLARLADLGAPIAFADVADRARGPIGRPHVAEALVAAGHAADRQDAFARYLADGGPAHVPSAGLGPAAAVRAVAAAGGAPVIAHPASLGLGADDLAAAVGRLAPLGLRGLEVYRPDHTPEQREEFGALARRLGLVATGGSDFHGTEGAPPLGDTGDPPLPADALERLLAREVR
jgi:predicted metal-dependent phosphoesterase TrpH